jgi:hypothetical protein
MAASRSTARSLSRSISTDVHQLQPPFTYGRCHEAREDSLATKRGEAELPPPSSSSKDSGSEGVSSPSALAAIRATL